MSEETAKKPARVRGGRGGKLMYLQVGSGSTALTPDTSEGRLALRDDLRDNGNILGAAVGVFLQDLAGVNVAYFAPLVVPTQINLHLRDAARDVAALRGEGELIRRGRTTMVTTARVFDDANPERLIGYGTISWATMGSTLETPPAELRSTTVTVTDTPQSPLVKWVGGVARADGRGLDLPVVMPELNEPVAPTGPQAPTLHGGPLQVLAEGAARFVAERHLGGRPVVTKDLSTLLLAPARHLPVSAIATVLTADDQSLDCEVQVREHGGEGPTVVLAHVRFEIGQ